MGLLLDKDNQMCFLVGKFTHLFRYTKKKRIPIQSIIDYIAGGTLKDIIHDLSIPLTWLQRLRYAKDIAAGMVVMIYLTHDYFNKNKKKHFFFRL